MISRSLSSVKRSSRLWVLVVSILASTLYYVLGTLFALVHTLDMNRSLGDLSSKDQKAYLITEMSKWVGLSQPGFIIVFILAILIGLEGYHFMTSRTAMDFYDSQPVRRTSRFWHIFGSGFMIWFLPYVINTILATVIGSFMGAVTVGVIAEIVLEMFHLIIFFLGVYSITVLGCMLTGKLVTNVIMTGFLLLLEPVIRMIGSAYGSCFFKNWVEPDWMFHMFTSPVYYYLKASGFVRYSYIQVWNLANNAVVNKTTLMKGIRCDVGNLILTAVVLVLAVYAYQRHTGEDAGKAIINPVIAAIVKVITATCSGLVFGLIIMLLLGTTGGGSFVVCLIFMIIVTLLTAIFAEVFYEFDIHAAFKRFYQAAISVGLMILVLGVFKQDLLGFDAYIPKSGQVKSFALYSAYDSVYTNLDSDMAAGDIAFIDHENEAYFVKKMALTNVNDMVRLAEYCRDNPLDKSSDTNYWAMKVTWNMKSGRSVTRAINIPYDVSPTLMDPIVGSQEYKKIIFQTAKVKSNADLSTEMSYVPNGGVEQQVEGMTAENFLEAFEQDLAVYNFKTASQSTLLGLVRIYFDDQTKISDGMGNYVTYPVYDNFASVIGLLDNYGVAAEQFVTADKLASIEITYSGENEEGDYVDRSATFDDPDQIREILQASICDDESYLWSRSNDNLDYDYSLYFYAAGGENIDDMEYYSYYLKKDQIPEFVTDALN